MKRFYFSLFNNPSIYFFFFFLICSWPFFNFSLTDADIAHWVPVAVDISKHFNFLTSIHDQAHGPLLSWGSGLLISFFGTSFYVLNLFNLFCGLLGLFFIYFGANQLFSNESITKLACFFYSTSVFCIYLSKTPMYDWPTTVFYFGFCVFYLSFLTHNKRHYFFLALLLMGIASLSRFSISLGLAGILVFSCHLIYKRSFFSLIQHGLSLLMVCFLFNFPWIFGQTITHGSSFLDIFIYDNFGRYIKEPGEHSNVYRDYYGFLIYVLVGILPYSFALLASIFQKGFFKRVIKDPLVLSLVFSFLPCLVLFSFSGHVKLGRYIAYVFPGLLLFLAHQLVVFDLKNPRFTKRCKRMCLIFSGLITILLLIQIFSFQSEAKEGLLFSLGCLLLVYGLLIVSYFLFSESETKLINRLPFYLLPIGALYLIFFSILASQSSHVSFLKSVATIIRDSL